MNIISFSPAQTLDAFDSMYILTRYMLLINIFLVKIDVKFTIENFA